MRTNTSIGLGVAIAALIVGVVYVTRWNVESPPPSTNVAGTQRAEQQLARPSDSSAIGSESSLSTSKPPRANYSTGFADASPINPTTDRATSVIASDADTIRLVRSLKLSNDDSDRLVEILNAEQKTIRDWVRANKRSFLSQTETDELRSDSNRAARELLGEDKFQQYDDYRKHPAERKQIDRLNEQLVRTESQPLSQDQIDRLFAVLKEEVSRTPAPELSAYGSHSDFEAALKRWREDNMKRAWERAASLLSADQQAAFQSVLKSSR